MEQEWFWPQQANNTVYSKILSPHKVFGFKWNSLFIYFSNIHWIHKMYQALDWDSHHLPRRYDSWEVIQVAECPSEFAFFFPFQVLSAYLTNFIFLLLVSTLSFCY